MSKINFHNIFSENNTVPYATFEHNDLTNWCNKTGAAQIVQSLDSPKVKVLFIHFYKRSLNFPISSQLELRLR